VAYRARDHSSDETQQGLLALFLIHEKEPMRAGEIVKAAQETQGIFGKEKLLHPRLNEALTAALFGRKKQLTVSGGR